MKPTLVILAAGASRRFGGGKQLAPVGPGGAGLMDYTIHDAVRAGFGKVVCVVDAASLDVCRDRIVFRWDSRITVVFVVQRAQDVPGGMAVSASRTKPWGTGQAVLSVRHEVAEPFAVVNADDFYGAGTIDHLAAFLRDADAAATTYALAPYALCDTLTAGTPVNRAVLTVDSEGWLRGIEERIGILRVADPSQRTQSGDCLDAARPRRLKPAARGAREIVHDCMGSIVASDGTVLDGETLVSMNAWALTPAVFDQLEAGFERFLADGPSDESEFYLPGAVRELVESGAAKVRVLETGTGWFGMTRIEDQADVCRAIRSLIDAGEYPEELGG